MKNFTIKQIAIPISVLAIILFIYFGPLTRVVFEHIIIMALIIGANFIEFKGKPFGALGLFRERFNAKNLLLIAPLVAFVLFVFYVFAMVPAIEMLTGVPIDWSSMSHLTGDLKTTLIWLAIVWATAAFGEEIIFRGYFMRQFVKFFGDSKVSIAINILLFSTFFGYMHMQQGLTGQIVAGSTGAILSLLFYFRKYDLWFNIMVHGFFNTLGLLSWYFGLPS